MEDFKQVAYFAVSLFVAAFIITLVAALSLIVGQTASARNGELLTSENLRLARYFAAYDNQAVMGSDVIALLRENAAHSKGLDVYVERDNYGVAMTMNAANGTNTTWRLSNLTGRIKADTIYRAILVYDGENPATAVYAANPGGVVTGVKFS